MPKKNVDYSEIEALKKTDSILVYGLATIDGNGVRLATNAVFETRDIANDVLEYMEDVFKDDELNIAIIPIHFIFNDWDLYDEEDDDDE